MKLYVLLLWQRNPPKLPGANVALDEAVRLKWPWRRIFHCPITHLSPILEPKESFLIAAAFKIQFGIKAIAL